MKRLLNYLKGVREEFGKISFPPRQQVLSHTSMVVVSIAIAVVAIGLLDLGLAQVVKVVFVR